MRAHPIATTRSSRRDAARTGATPRNKGKRDATQHKRERAEETTHARRRREHTPERPCPPKGQRTRTQRRREETRNTARARDSAHKQRHAKAVPCEMALTERGVINPEFSRRNDPGTNPKTCATTHNDVHKRIA